ncbi:MAG TPA: hypothetical protein VHH88_04335 [Verrucomicrobiae bacterium]|nr:hypothetical protein [Verrucomicrobiae bacterium]
MKTTSLALTAGALAFLTASVAFSQTTIVSDNFTAVNVGNGFALGNGVNSDINPPNSTRLTGSAAANLRYLKRGPKNDSAYTISGNAVNITKGAQAGRFTISEDSINPYDFGPILGSLAASPTNPAVYQIAISMKTGSTKRIGFGFSTVESSAGSWNIGFEIVKNGSAFDVYKRIDTAASGLGAELNATIATTGAVGSYVNLLLQITDSGAETSAYSSRVQLSFDGGATWAYDSQTDPDLVNGWHFEAGSRYVSFDQPINSDGPDNYDNFSVVWISGPPPTEAAVRVWTGGGADANWSTPANWLDNTVPGTGDSVAFAGASQQANFNDISGLSLASVTFSNGDFVLSGNPWTNTTAIMNAAGNNTIASDLTWGSVSGKSWNIASASELKLSGTTTIETAGDHVVLGGGVVRLTGSLNLGQATTANPAFSVYEGQVVVDGGVFTSRGGYRIGSLADAPGGAQTVVTNGGTFTLTVPGANLRVGDSANPVTARLIVDNSTLAMAGGSIGIPYDTGATSEVWQTGGLISGAIINFSQSGAGRGTFGITNGTLQAIQIKENNSGGLSRIYFDNAVLRPDAGASNAFFSGLNTAEIEAGGLTLDTPSDITIAQKLSGAGGLVKSNYLAAYLTAANTYSGTTLVQQGKLAFASRTNLTSVQVADTAEFGIVESAAGATASLPSLSFLGTSYNTLSFDLGAFSNPTAPLLSVGSLSVSSGSVAVNILNGLLLKPGQFTLVSYSGTIVGGYQFYLNSVPPGVGATLVNNTANNSIDLLITSVPGFVWTGAVSGDWDYSTQNWIDQQTGSASTYQDNYPVLFPDNATTGDINVTGFPFPGYITVSNTALAYTWNNGAITAPGLIKKGTNSLTRIENESDIINSVELDEGAFVISNVFDSTFSSVLSDNGAGTGTLISDGPSMLTINVANGNFHGTVAVGQGIIKLGNDRALGAASAGVIISNGATLDLANFTPGAQPVIVSGAGTTGQGAIIDSTASTAVDVNLQDVTMVGDTALGAPNGGRWDLRIRSSTGAHPGLNGNGFNLTKVGSGLVSIACQRSLTPTPYWHMNLGDVFIQGGILAFAESLSLDNPEKSIFISPGATLQLYDLNITNPIVRNIFSDNGELLPGGNNTDTNVINGSINLTGANSVMLDQGVFVINGAVTGAGSLGVSANEPGRIYLNGNNTFTGDLTITNGTVGGTGSLAGNLVMLGGTNSPGGLTPIGTFTVNGNATLAGTTLMQLDRAASPNSDRLVVGGTLAYGGVLKVLFAPGAAAPQAGDVYQLFNKAGVGSFSSVSLPNLSGYPGGLAWDSTKLTVDGTITITGTATPPTIGSVSVSGGNLVFSGTGGVEGSSYVVLTSPDLSTPLSSWTPVATNVFGAGGTFSYSAAVNSAAPASFFALELQ